MPRARRAVWYENDDNSFCEVGLSYETNLIFTVFKEEGYDTNIVENMQVMMGAIWPKLEVSHARLYLMNYYFKNTEYLNEIPHPLEAKMKRLIGRIIMFGEYFEQDKTTDMKSIFCFLKFCVELELEIMKDLITSDFKPKNDLWIGFVKAIHKINFWSFHFDVISKFFNEIGRRSFNTNFCTLIFARIEALINVWLPDSKILEFESVVELVEPSDDFTGDILPVPIPMESTSCLLGGMNVSTAIGEIQADQYEFKIAIRFKTANMISPINYDVIPYGDIMNIYEDENRVEKATLQNEQVITYMNYYDTIIY